LQDKSYRATSPSIATNPWEPAHSARCSLSMESVIELREQASAKRVTAARARRLARALSNVEDQPRVERRAAELDAEAAALDAEADALEKRQP
jgi:hypothetical protein